MNLIRYFYLNGITLVFGLALPVFQFGMTLLEGVDPAVEIRTFGLEMLGPLHVFAVLVHHLFELSIQLVLPLPHGSQFSPQRPILLLRVFSPLEHLLQFRENHGDGVPQRVQLFETRSVGNEIGLCVFIV